MVQAAQHPVPKPAPDPADVRGQDAALLARYAAGDQSAARALVSAHLPRVHALAWRLLGDQAEAQNVAQEAMMRLWQVAPRWRAGEALVSTWLHRVTVNLSTDILRRRARFSDAPVPELPDPAPGAEAGLIDSQQSSKVRRALASLPPRQRLAITLRHFEEMSNPEIAQALDTSVEAVESLLARGRRALADILADLATRQES